jgi:hypothetical protein
VGSKEDQFGIDDHVIFGLNNTMILFVTCHELGALTGCRGWKPMGELSWGHWPEFPPPPTAPRISF